MNGTTRSRVSFFMNRFRKLGFISYNGRIQVCKSLLNVVVLDQLPEHNAEKPPGTPSTDATVTGALRRCCSGQTGMLAKIESSASGVAKG